MATDFAALRNEAKDLRQSGKYKEATEAFRKLWNDSETKNIWDGWGLSYSLNKLKNYLEAYKVSKEIYKIDPQFEYNISQLTQSSYMSNIKYFPADGDAAELTKYVYEVLEISDSKTEDLFRIQSVLKMMEFSAKNNYWEKVLEWSENINPEVLSSNDYRGRTNDGKNYIKPSDKESYYLKTSKALVKLGRYPECIEKSEEGLSSLRDNVWLMWHKGHSFSKLGKQEQAIEILEKLRVRKSEWYILKDLSAAYYRKGDFHNSLNVFLDTALGSIRVPKPENRWELYFLGGMIYKKLAETEKADKHFSLSMKLREDNDWKIKDSLNAEIESRDLDLNTPVKEQLDLLNSFWQNEKQTRLPQKEGTIKNFIGIGKSGFIKVENGDDIYFNLRNVEANTALEAGDKVSFRIRKSFDKSKGIESTEAVFVKKIS